MTSETVKKLKERVDSKLLDLGMSLSPAAVRNDYEVFKEIHKCLMFMNALIEEMIDGDE